ncbi:MAG TPA: polyprenyl synthetase family protein [Candidatus Dormibacteraeota bacterium]|nr:polyprenyl synthetase family protein [Candidatus Dormibacteraeota bacterium]
MTLAADPHHPFDDLDRRLADSAAAGGPPKASAALTHILTAGGKRLRPHLVRAFGALLGGDPRRLVDLALAVEMLHAATLVHDDVIDNAQTRRGRPALHVKTDGSVALLVGDLYLARCGVHLAAVGDPRATRELFGALETIVRGELGQRDRRFDLGQTEADYVETIQRKTASLVEAACAAAVVVSGGADAMVERAREYGHHLGLAFQIVDDVLDYTADARELGKPVGNDIREGTVTLPLILALRAGGRNLRATLKAARQAGDFGPVVEAVRGGRAIPACTELADRHAAAAVAALDAFPGRHERAELADLALALNSRRV